MIIKGYICLFIHKDLCCVYSLESPRCEAILMSTHNIGFYEVLTKIIIKYHQLCALSPLLFKYTQQNN